MNMNIIPFDYEGSQIRVIMQNGEPWWVANDVCQILEISNVGNTLARLDDDEKNIIHTVDGNRGNPNIAVINEPGLYKIIFTSRKPEAKAFKRWITHEVLPSIRKTGSYSVHKQPVQGGIASDLAAILNDQKSLKKFVHALNDLQEILYPKHIQEVPTQPEKLKNDILRVLSTHQTSMTAAILHGSWIKNVDTPTIQEALDEMVNAGLLIKTVSNAAKQGKYSLA